MKIIWFVFTFVLTESYLCCENSVARTVVRAVRQSSNSRPPRSGSDPWEGTPIESICKVMEREFQHIERGEFGHILNWKSFISRVAPSAKELFSYVQPIVEEEDGKKKFKLVFDVSQFS